MKAKLKNDYNENVKFLGGGHVSVNIKSGRDMEVIPLDDSYEINCSVNTNEVIKVFLPKELFED